MKKKICVLVDNPLRDLDGVGLLAWHLACQDVEVHLVPLYNQAFDVFALAPDAVVVNYVRTNNVDFLKRVHNRGIKIIVLDTEGTPSPDLSLYVSFVNRLNCDEFVSKYLHWGHDQLKIFKLNKVLPDDRLALTGCPRYDFCVEPFRGTLPKSKALKPHYILINTTFSQSNPKFTSGPEDEVESMVRLGFSRAHSQRYVADNQRAFIKIIELIRTLADRYPDEHFVLRPHPFESTRIYEERIQNSNFEVRQEGTSLQWINESKCVLHLNCLTSVEAILMGKEAINFEWLNTEALLHNSPALNVSRLPENQDALFDLLDRIIAGIPLPEDSGLLTNRGEIVESRFFANDGQSSSRAAREIIKVLETPNLLLRQLTVKVSLKQLARSFIGFKYFHKIRKKLEAKSSDARRESKLFSYDEVSEIISRIERALGVKQKVLVSPSPESSFVKRHMSSGESIQLLKNKHFIET